MRAVRAWGPFVLALVASAACGARTELERSDASGGPNGNDGGRSAVAGGRSGSGSGGGAASGGVTTTPAGGRAAGSGGVLMPRAGAGGVATGGAANGAGRGTGGRGAGGRGRGGRNAGGAGSGGVAGSSTAGSPDAGAAGSTGSDCVVRVATTGNDANDGGGWTRALGSVQGALDAARALIASFVCPSVEIWVAAGTYYPSARTDAGDAKTATFTLVPGVGLYGGFAGTESQRRQRDVTGNVTVLSGAVGDPANPGSNVYHVVTGASNATLDGFTITAGTANGAAPHDAGGGMINDAVSPVVAHCVFQGNSAGGGGAMYNHAASPVVLNCTFDGNTAPVGKGGAMYDDSASPVVSDSTFTNNSARYNGGAIDDDYSSPHLTRCKFAHNVADASGGALAENASSPVVTSSTFVLNTSYLGGALTLVDSSGSLDASTFTQNSAYQGGAIFDFYSTTPVTNTTFWANAAVGTAQSGGDAFASGGAIFNDVGASLVVTGSTFASNVADYSGGAIANVDSTLSVTNSILWGDVVGGTSIGEIADSGAAAESQASYSLIQDGYPAGTGVGLSNPLFVAGATGDLRLGATSPAIDAGFACADQVTLTDGAGNGRWDIASVPNAVSAVDIGALEYQGAAGTDTPVGDFGCP